MLKYYMVYGPKYAGIFICVINIDRPRDILDLLSLGQNISNLMQCQSSEFVSIQQNPDKNSQNNTKTDNLPNRHTD